MTIWNDEKLREVARDPAATRTEALLANAFLTQKEITRSLVDKLDAAELQVQTYQRGCPTHPGEAFTSECPACLRLQMTELVAVAKQHRQERDHYRSEVQAFRLQAETLKRALNKCADLGERQVVEMACDALSEVSKIQHQEGDGHVCVAADMVPCKICGRRVES